MRRLILATALLLVATGASAQDHRIAAGRWFGCPVKTDFERATLYLTQGDREAAARVVVESRCTLFTAGERVYRTDVSIFSGMVRVRRPGGTGEYWTNIEAIQ